LQNAQEQQPRRGLPSDVYLNFLGRRVMKIRNALIAGAALLAAAGWTVPAQAHCDTLDGPVVSAGRKALDSGNVNLALVWVQRQDEAELRHAFDKARTVRKGGAEAKELADTYFFETLVRIHRAGEGAGFTGLKSAGTVEAPVAAADKAIETEDLQGLAKVIAERTEEGLHTQFEQMMAKKKYAPNDVEAGRAYTGAYVEFVHYAERLYDAATTPAPEHGQKTPASAYAH
jgi:hypothetical protein